MECFRIAMSDNSNKSTLPTAFFTCSTHVHLDRPSIKPVARGPFAARRMIFCHPLLDIKFHIICEISLLFVVDNLAFVHVCAHARFLKSLMGYDRTEEEKESWMQSGEGMDKLWWGESEFLLLWELVKPVDTLKQGPHTHTHLRFGVKCNFSPPTSPSPYPVCCCGS